MRKDVIIELYFSFQALRLHSSFKEALDRYGGDELPVKEMVEKLMTNTIKDNICMFPQIYPPEKEHYLSSIFVDAETPLVSYCLIT